MASSTICENKPKNKDNTIWIYVISNVCKITTEIKNNEIKIGNNLLFKNKKLKSAINTTIK